MDALACELTGMDAEELAAHKFEMAYRYLEEIIGTDAYGMEQIPQTDLFWGHWMMVWYRLDVLIMEGDSETTPLIRYDIGMQEYYYTADGNEYRCHSSRQIRQIYLDHHSAAGMQLNRAVVNEGWHQYIKSLNGQNKI